MTEMTTQGGDTKQRNRSIFSKEYVAGMVHHEECDRQLLTLLVATNFGRSYQKLERRVEIVIWNISLKISNVQLRQTNLNETSAGCVDSLIIGENDSGL